MVCNRTARTTFSSPTVHMYMICPPAGFVRELSVLRSVSCAFSSAPSAAASHSIPPSFGNRNPSTRRLKQRRIKLEQLQASRWGQRSPGSSDYKENVQVKCLAVNYGRRNRDSGCRSWRGCAPSWQLATTPHAWVPAKNCTVRTPPSAWSRGVDKSRTSRRALP